MIACTHPGKIGDVFAAIPVVKYLCEARDEKADFYTSLYCLPVTRLLEYQPFIRKVIVPENYTAQNFGCGGQPWEMPVETNNYTAVFQLGYRSFPTINITQHMFNSIGLNPTNINLEGTFQYPEIETLDEPYIAVALRKDRNFGQAFREFILNCPLTVVKLGTADENWINPGVDKTGLDFLETVSWLADAKGFVGMLSALGILAHNFPYKKVFLGRDAGWDMRHVNITPTSSYPVLPSGEELLATWKL